jgi:hypothetical protein
MASLKLAQSVLSVLKGSLATVDRLDLKIIDQEGSLREKRARGSQRREREGMDQDDDDRVTGEAMLVMKMVCKYGALSGCSVLAQNDTSADRSRGH